MNKMTVLRLIGAAWLLSGCAATHRFERVQQPSIVFKDEPNAVGLIDAKTFTQEALDQTYQAAVYRGIQDAIGSRMDVRTFDVRNQQHEIRWSKKPDFSDKIESFFTFTPTKAPAPFLILGQNSKIEPPLVVSIVFGVNDKASSLGAYIMFWTRTGVLLEKNMAVANIDNVGYMTLKINESEVITRSGISGHPYERGDEGWDARSFAPSDSSQRFLFMLKHAYGAMLYPYLSHKQASQIIFVEEPSSLATGIALTKQNKFAEAYAEFVRVADAEPKNHGALNNAAQVKWAMGDSKTAAELMKKANAISSTGLSKGLQEQYEREAMGAKVIDANVPPPPPPALEGDE